MNGDGPGDVPANNSFDLSLGHNVGESFTARLVSTNITNNRYQLDNSNIFGGSHWANPCFIGVQAHYKFRY